MANLVQNTISNEPVMVWFTSLSVILPAIYGLVASFGYDVSAGQQQAITSLAMVLVGVYVRSKVSPPN